MSHFCCWSFLSIFFCIKSDEVGKIPCVLTSNITIKYSYSFKVTQVHRQIITEEKVAVAKKDEAPPKRGISSFIAT